MRRVRSLVLNSFSSRMSQSKKPGRRVQVIDIDFVLAIEVALVRVVIAVYRIRVIEAELHAVAHAPLYRNVSAIIAGVADRPVDIDLACGGIGSNDGDPESPSGRIQVDSLSGSGIVA